MEFFFFGRFTECITTKRRERCSTDRSGCVVYLLTAVMKRHAVVHRGVPNRAHRVVLFGII